MSQSAAFINMPSWTALRTYAIPAAIAAVGSSAVVAHIAFNQRRLIYFPSHDAVQTPLRPATGSVTTNEAPSATIASTVNKRIKAILKQG